MKAGKKKWLWLAVRVSLMAMAFYILLRAGLNPFWSVLALIYWKTILKLGMLVLGLAYFAHTVMN